MSDSARRWTDKRLKGMEKRLERIYSEAQKDIDAKANTFFQQFEEMDVKKRAQLDAGEITKEEYQRWQRTKIFQAQNWKKAQENIVQQYLNINKTAIAYINGELPEIYSRNFNYISRTVADAIDGISFNLVDATTVKNLATTNKSLLPYKKVNEKKYIRWNTKKVNNAVMQGIIQGESIPDIAKRLQSVTEMDKNSAIRNARTSVTSAENKGRLDSAKSAAEKGVIMQKQWIATHDSRTRDSHISLDGVAVDLDKEFDNGLMYPGDPNGAPEEVYNCRCSTKSVILGFKKI